MSATQIRFPAGPEHLSIDWREEGEDLILSVHGEVDLGHLLLIAHRHAQSNGPALVLANVPRQARRLFRLTGVDAELAIE